MTSPCPWAANLSAEKSVADFPEDSVPIGGYFCLLTFSDSVSSSALEWFEPDASVRSLSIAWNLLSFLDVLNKVCHQFWGV